MLDGWLIITNNVVFFVCVFLYVSISLVFDAYAGSETAYAAEPHFFPFHYSAVVELGLDTRISEMNARCKRRR